MNGSGCAYVEGWSKGCQPKIFCIMRPEWYSRGWGEKEEKRVASEEEE